MHLGSPECLNLCVVDSKKKNSW